MFALDQICKRFGPTTALEQVSLDFPAGTSTALIGPSGCGKSTLLRLMVGLIGPDSGTLTFDGEPLAPASLSQLRRRLGYVIQDGGLFPHLSARGNIALMARYLGWPASRIEQRVNELCELTRFPRAALRRYPIQLSGGQNQRVALMRALMLDPAVLLLDEPLGALDPMIRFDLQEDLKRICNELGKTVALVTHDLAEAAFLCERIVLLRAGRIVQVGTLKDMLNAPAEPFVERFIQAQRSHLTEVAA